MSKLRAVRAILALSHQMVKNFERAPFAHFALSLRSLALSSRSLRSLTTLAQNSSPSAALNEYQTKIVILNYQFGINKFRYFEFATLKGSVGSVKWNFKILACL